MNEISTPDATPAPEELYKEYASKPHRFNSFLQSQLEKGLTQLETGPDARKLPDQHWELLKVIYTERNQRFINDNNKIWTAASIFIPLSFAGLVSLKDMDVFATTALGLASSALIFFWYTIAEHHRALQSKSNNVVKAIELHAGLDVGEDARLDKAGNLKKWYLIGVRKARGLMVWLVLSIWTAAVVYKCFTYPSAPAQSVQQVRLMKPDSVLTATHVAASADRASPNAPLSASRTPVADSSRRKSAHREEIRRR